MKKKYEKKSKRQSFYISGNDTVYFNKFKKITKQNNSKLSPEIMKLIIDYVNNYDGSK